MLEALPETNAWRNMKQALVTTASITKKPLRSQEVRKRIITEASEINRTRLDKPIMALLTTTRSILGRRFEVRRAHQIADANQNSPRHDAI